MMKLMTVATALTLTLLVGCGKETENAKSPGSTEKPADENTFNLTLPSGATNIAPNGQESMTISVDRGDNLKSDIKLTFQPPTGVTVDPATATIPADKDEVDVMVKVAEDAKSGEQAIKVKGEGDGKVSEGSFKIEVKRDTDADNTNNNANKTNTNPPE